MSEMSDFMQVMAEEIVPEITACTFPFLLDIETETTGAVVGGERPTTGTSVAVANVPCNYEMKRRTIRDTVADKLKHEAYYTLIFATTLDGAHIDRNSDAILVVKARGLMPEKRFTVEAWQDDGGSMYKVNCVLEN